MSFVVTPVFKRHRRYATQHYTQSVAVEQAAKLAAAGVPCMVRLAQSPNRAEGKEKRETDGPSPEIIGRGGWVEQGMPVFSREDADRVCGLKEGSAGNGLTFVVEGE